MMPRVSQASVVTGAWRVLSCVPRRGAPHHLPGGARVPPRMVGLGRARVNQGRISARLVRSGRWARSDPPVARSTLRSGSATPTTTPPTPVPGGTR
jgi:hypothetical protein